LKSNAGNLASTPSIEPPPQSEQDLLKLREANAKAALRNTTQELGRNLLSILDIRPTVREHPWKSSGAAALAGFFVALKVVPGGEDKALENLAPGVSSTASASPWASIASTLVETGGGAVKAALMPWLVQKIQEWMPKGATGEEAQADTKPEEAPFSP